MRGPNNVTVTMVIIFKHGYISNISFNKKYIIDFSKQKKLHSFIRKLRKTDRKY